MKIISHPKKEKWAELLSRPVQEYKDIQGKVTEIIDDVAARGDAAVMEYTKKYDSYSGKDLLVSKKEIQEAEKHVSTELKKAIQEALWNIQTFHKKQAHPYETIVTTAGVRCWQRPVPIESVGLYIPGGSAPLLSTVLMLGVPARVAGCREIVLCTPPDKDGKINPSILYIAGLLEIELVYKIGGAQAIAAMAYGTETVRAVHKIFGPGNQFVMRAKQIVSRYKVAIDMPAGPSELAVLADKSSNPAFIASDLLSQAEHGPDSQVLLLADSEKMLKAVQKELKAQLAALPRKDIAEEALKHSHMILMKSQDEMMEMINSYAPEHLIIFTENYTELIDKVVNAGSVFLGPYSPESAGDYASGTNHTLPTNGWARSYSGVSLDSFVKKITFQEISKYGLLNIGEAIMTLAEAEELQAHSNAVRVRLNEGNAS